MCGILYSFICMMKEIYNLTKSFPVSILTIDAQYRGDRLVFMHLPGLSYLLTLPAVVPVFAWYTVGILAALNNNI